MKISKPVYQVVKSAYHNFKLLDGLKFYKRYTDFLNNNQVISNYAQIIEVVDVINELLKEEAAYQKNLEKLQSIFLACLEIMVTYDKFESLKVVNQTYLNNLIVRIYGKYGPMFLQWDMPELTNWITKMFDCDIRSLELNNYVEIYQEFLKLIKASLFKASDSNFEKGEFCWTLEKELSILNLLHNLTEANLHWGEK